MLTFPVTTQSAATAAKVLSGWTEPRDTAAVLCIRSTQTRFCMWLFVSHPSRPGYISRAAIVCNDQAYRDSGVQSRLSCMKNIRGRQFQYAPDNYVSVVAANESRSCSVAIRATLCHASASVEFVRKLWWCDHSRSSIITSRYQLQRVQPSSSFSKKSNKRLTRIHVWIMAKRRARNKHYGVKRKGSQRSRKHAHSRSPP